LELFCGKAVKDFADNLVYLQNKEIKEWQL